MPEPPPVTTARCPSSKPISGLLLPVGSVQAWRAGTCPETQSSTDHHGRRTEEARRRMWKATIRGILARRVRLALTALAVVLGVTFVTGTYVLTDTLDRSFN